MAEKKMNAYRAVITDILDCYKPGGDLSKIPNLEGKNFNQGGGVNNDCNYLPEQKYLHFFPTLEDAESYALGLVEEFGKKVSIIGCSFDEEVLKNCTFKGFYFTDAFSGRGEVSEEYIIPLELYRPEENFIKVVSSKSQKDLKDNYDPDGYMSGWF